MAGRKTGYQAKAYLGGTQISEADNVEIDFDVESHDCTDLSDYLVHMEPGATAITVRGDATYGGASARLISRIHTAITGFASVVVKVEDQNGSVVLSGYGHWRRAGTQFPRGAVKQPWEATVHSISNP